MNGSILVFGAGGMVGREIVRLGQLRQEKVAALTRHEADVTDPDAVSRAIETAQPRLIVNAAAYTAVDKAESEPQSAMAVNADGAGLVAAMAERYSVPVLHLSTDYVFDGNKRVPYVESDDVCPVSAYGRTKAEGEKRVCEAASRRVILRTAWVYGVHGRNFLKTIMKLACERDELRVVSDQVGCPTCARDVAEAAFAVAGALEAGARPWSVYHFAGSGETSWHGFAREIVRAQSAWTGRRPVVTAIASSHYPTAARRPLNSRLDSSLFASTFRYEAADWRRRTAETVRELSEVGVGAFP